MQLNNFNGTAIVICALTLLSIIACAQPFNTMQPLSKHPKLESVLSQLIDANNSYEFALVHSLYIKNGNARVVVELANETDLLPDYVVEETRYRTKVQALVPVEKLANLSEEASVSFIRAPLKPYADTQTASAIQTSPAKSGFNTAIYLILSIALIFIIMKCRSDEIVKK